MPSPRSCPSCRTPFQALFVGRVELDRCFACESTWFDARELEILSQKLGTLEMTREHPAAHCPACRGLLWFARRGSCEMLACIDCGGSFVGDAQLSRLAPERRAGGVPVPGLQFICVGCKDRYALPRAQHVSAGLACANCAGRFEPVQVKGPSAPPPPASGAAAPSSSSSTGFDWVDWLDILSDLLIR